MNNGERIEFVGTFKPAENIAEELPERIKYIAGRLNNCNATYFWNIDSYMDFEIGDYAIVENMNDYDLIKIIGIIETTEKYAKYISNHKINKKVVSIIDREDIRED